MFNSLFEYGLNYIDTVLSSDSFLYIFLGLFTPVLVLYVVFVLLFIFFVQFIFVIFRKYKAKKEDWVKLDK